MANSPLKILLVHNSYQLPGGEDSVVENEMRILRDAGCHVVTYFRSNTEINSYSAFQKLVLPIRSVYSRKSYKELYKIIKEEQIDLVHVHNTLSVISPSVYYAALDCHVPVVQTIHNYRLVCPNAMLLRDGQVCMDCLSKGLSESLKHNCYRNSKLQTFVSTIILRYHRWRKIYRKVSYICLTDFNKQILLRLNHSKKKDNSLELIHPDSVFVKPNFAADPGTIIPYDKRKNHFLYISRMESYKGIHVLLDAWQKYESSVSDNVACKELYLCGSGPEEDKVKEFISSHRLQHIHFLGQLAHDKILDLIKDSLAVCIPSLCYEGFPVTIAESYAAGTPVIGSDLGNVGNLISHNETGFKFPAGNADALADIFIHWNMNYAKSANTISENVRTVYEQQYTEEINQQQLLDIYEKVLNHENRNHCTQSK